MREEEEEVVVVVAVVVAVDSLLVCAKGDLLPSDKRTGSMLNNDDDETVNDQGRQMLAVLALLRSQMRTEVDDLRVRLGKETKRAGDDLRDRMKQIVAPLQDDVERLNRELGYARQQWQEAQDRSLRWHTRVLWSWGSLLVLCLLSLMVNYQAIFGYYHERLAQQMGQMNYMDAINRSDVVPCGDGRLCARVDDKAPRVGDKKQYRLIGLRQ